MSTKELQQNIIDNMKKWQGIEDASVASTGKAMEQTQNPVIRLVLEIIQRDSLMHHRVQQLIADSLEKTVALTPEELGEVWDQIQNHIKIEKKTMDLAASTLDAIKGKKMLVQEYLLHYLMQDEKKHEDLLEQLEGVKKGMYPYG